MTDFIANDTDASIFSSRVIILWEAIINIIIILCNITPSNGTKIKNQKYPKFADEITSNQAMTTQNSTLVKYHKNGFSNLNYITLTYMLGPNVKKKTF